MTTKKPAGSVQKEILANELAFCLDLWDKQGYCNFGGTTNCRECATPYLVWKLLSGEVLHGKEMQRLGLDQWKEKLASLKECSVSYPLFLLL